MLRRHRTLKSRPKGTSRTLAHASIQSGHRNDLEAVEVRTLAHGQRDDVLASGTVGFAGQPRSVSGRCGSVSLRTSRPASRSWTLRSKLASTSSTPLMSTAARSRRTWRRDTASRRRSSAAGCSAPGVATRSSSRRRSISRWGPGPNDRRLSAYHIRRACEASLRRLQTDHIDLYQMHHVDRATPWEEIWQAMEQLVREGKISYVGSSNFAAWDVALAQSRRVGTALHGLGLRAEPLQPRGANGGAGTDSGAAEPWHRPHSLQPAQRRLACRCIEAATRTCAARPAAPSRAAPRSA